MSERRKNIVIGFFGAFLIFILSFTLVEILKRLIGLEDMVVMFFSVFVADFILEKIVAYGREG